MERERLFRSRPAAVEGGTGAAPLSHLDRDLDRRFELACARVAYDAEGESAATLTAGVAAHPLAQLWAACEARAAELCSRYGVEILLAEEADRIRIRIERHAPPAQESFGERRRAEKSAPARIANSE